MVKKKLNILVVHETEYINKVIYEYQIIPEILSSRGNNVYVVDFPSRWKSEGIFKIFSLRSSYLRTISRTKKKRGITLIRPGFIKIPVLSRITAYFTYFPLIHRIIGKYRIDAVLLYGVPTNGLQTLLLSKIHRVPVFFRLLDVSHQIVPSILLSLPSYLFERIVYSYSARLYAISPRLLAYAVRMGANKKTSFFLPTGSDDDIFYPQPKDRNLLRKYGLHSTDKILIFSGTLYKFSGLKELIKEFPALLKKAKNLKLLIVGDGEQYSFLRSMVKSLHLERVIHFAGYQEYSILPKYINLADVCINPFLITPVTRLIVPGKIYQYLACAKPVIASRLPGLMDVFPDNKGESGIYYYQSITELPRLLTHMQRVKINQSISLQTIAQELERDISRYLKSGTNVR